MIIHNLLEILKMFKNLFEFVSLVGEGLIVRGYGIVSSFKHAYKTLSNRTNMDSNVLQYKEYLSDKYVFHSEIYSCYVSNVPTKYLNIYHSDGVVSISFEDGCGYTLKFQSLGILKNDYYFSDHIKEFLTLVKKEPKLNKENVIDVVKDELYYVQNSELFILTDYEKFKILEILNAKL